MTKKILYVFGVILFVGLFTGTVCGVPVEIPEGKVVVYPNPWIPKSGKALVTNEDTKKHGQLSADGWVKFAWKKNPAVPNPVGTLRIYSVTGDLVRKIEWNADVEEANFPRRTGGQEASDVSKYHIIHWDGKNDRYEYVESGVYIWIFNQKGAKSHNGKIAVIR